MKKAKLLFSFVFICVTLSFFSICYGATFETDCFSVDWPNHQASEGVEGNGENTDILLKNAGNFQLRIICKKTGLYQIKCSVMNNATTIDSGEPQKYKITKDGSQTLTIPAFQGSNGQYQLYSSYEPNNDTSTVVYLEAGQSYCLNAPDGKAHWTITRRTSGSINGVPIIDPPIITDYSTYSKTMNTNSVSTNIYKPANIVTLRANGNNNVVSPSGNRIGLSQTDTSNNPFEINFVNFLLQIGDFLVSVIDDVIGEEVTVTKLVYNEVDVVNANFFDGSVEGNGFGGKDFKKAINDWYQFFKILAISFYLVALLGIGIHALINSTSSGYQKARELLVEWAKGIAILFIMPFIMSWVFQINEGLIKAVSDDSVRGEKIGSSFTSTSEWSAEEIEFRSPKYISKYTGKLSYGTEESNNGYMHNLTEYKQSLDLMRVMRAYAGYTGKLGYTVLWYILIGQLIVFIFLYYKRYFIIAFLIAVFPVVCVFNAISIIKGQKGPQFSTWFKEFLTNVFTQFIHALIYSVITGIIVSIVKENFLGATSTGALNWIIIIVSINFVPEGEKVIKRFLSKIGGGKTGPDIHGSAGGIKNIYSNATQNIKQIMGARK